MLGEAFTARLRHARLTLPTALPAYLARYGRAVRYGYVDRDWPVEAYQTVFATVPGSSEMPSAARPFTAETVARLAYRGFWSRRSPCTPASPRPRPTKPRTPNGSPSPPPPPR